MEQPEQNIEALNDLPVADDAHVKGGPVVMEDVKVTSYQLGVLDNNHGTHVAGTFGAVGNNNHNETTAADEATSTFACGDQVLSADLSITDEQAQQVKGGTDQFSVNYAKIEFEYKPQSAS